MATVVDFSVTAREARGLTCPFTGKDLQIIGHIDGGLVVYNAPKAFSLAEPQKSIARLYARASMRNGVENSVSKDDAMIDPYTGDRFTLASSPDGYFFRGGFNPRQGSMSLEDFILKASRGTRKISKPPVATSVDNVEADVPTPADDSQDPHKAVEEMSEKAAHEMAKAAGLDHGRTTVSMSLSPNKKKPKKG